MFCTYLTVYHGNKLPPFYIGHSTVTKVENGYHGSVKSKEYELIWKSELKENPHLFKTIILTIHQTREDASTREECFQRFFRVDRNPMYINRHIGISNFYNRGGYNLKEKTKEKISIARTGVKHSQESITKMKKNNWAKNNPDHLTKITKMASIKKKGVSHCPAHSKKISDTLKEGISSGRIVPGRQRSVEYKGVIYSSLKEIALIYSEENGFSYQYSAKMVKKDKSFRRL